MGTKLAGSETRQTNATLLRMALGGLKGPLMKVAQLVATIPDFLPPEYAAELATLQSSAPPMGWPFVRRRMAAELGANWQTKFKSFEQSACAAASLGQVHKAIANNGQPLACKLQYPDMASVVEADLQQLKLIFSLFEQFDKSVDTEQAYQEVAARLREELDYSREARAMALYGDMLAPLDCVHVPQAIPDLSTSRLLTMSWLEGSAFVDSIDTRDQKARNQIAMNMFRLWYLPFYRYGVIHGDPHLGNYTIRKDNSINLLDFGCIRIFKPQIIQAIIMLYEALRDDKKEMIVEAYRLWGFTDITNALIEVLTLWARFIYAPVLDDQTRTLAQTNSTAHGRETAAKIHRELKKIGGVAVPPEFVMIDRASVGLGSVFLRLNAELNWCELFSELTKDFDVSDLTQRQNAMLKKHAF